VGLYYAGITVGRILAGFISFKLSNKQLITLGILIALAGSILLVGNISDNLSMMAFILIGLGFAPIFPSMVHETPKRFGNKIAQSWRCDAAHKRWIISCVYASVRYFTRDFNCAIESSNEN
jgi:fucose permease